MPDILLLPQVNLLLSSTHRATVQKRSYNVIVAIYKQLYEKVHSEGSSFKTIADQIFSKKPEQVAELLCG
jgi:conserved oligomeric Golgi complex subunit 6